MDLLILLCAGGSLALSAALAWKGRGRRSLPGCGIGSSCAEVTTGRWSRVGAVRVVNLGVVIYAGMFAAGVWRFLIGINETSQMATRVLAAVSTVAVGSALWFVLIQALIVRKWCPWCVAIHALALIGGGAALALVGVDHAMALPIAIGVGAIAILALGQIVVRPKLYAVVEDLPRVAEAKASITRDESRSVAPPTEGPGEGEKAEAPAVVEVEARREAFVNGRVKLDLNHWPVLGPRAAPHLVVDLFDYTCHQCRELHGHLVRVRERYPDAISVVMVPMPQEMRCNPYLGRQNPEHVNACDYASYALAVWLSDEQKFEEYDRWLFEPEHVPGVQDARRMAETMVGRERFEQALAKQSLDGRIKEGIDFYMSAGAGAIPQLLLRDVAILGQIPSFEKVCDVLERRFGLNGKSMKGRGAVRAEPSQIIEGPPRARPDVHVIDIDPNKFKSRS